MLSSKKITYQQYGVLIRQFSNAAKKHVKRPAKRTVESVPKTTIEGVQKTIQNIPTYENNSYFKSLMKLLKSQQEIPMIYTAFNTKINFVTEDFINSLNLQEVQKKLNFSDMRINDYLIDVLTQNDISKPFESQLQSIPHIMKGRNVIIESATGSGKTLAFLLPICNSMGEKSCSNIIVVPSRELATQIYKEFMKYTTDKVLISRHVSGINEEQDMNLKKALRYSKVLIGTPKKIFEIIEDNPGYFRNTKRLIFDEVDKLLPLTSMKTRNKNKVKPSEKILSMIKYYQKNVQLIATSATISRNLIEELQLLGFGKYCKVIKLTPKNYPFGQIPSNIKHNFIQSDDSNNDSKFKLIARMFEASNEKSALVFTDRGQSVENVVDCFKELGLNAVALYKELLLPRTTGYENFLEAFKSGKIDLVVSTEETMRGIDFPFINQSYLTYIPDSPVSYIHVAGRVGRSGQASTVTTLLNSSEWQSEKRRLKRKYLLAGVKGRLLVA